MIDFDLLLIDEMKDMPAMPMVTTKKPNTKIIYISSDSPNQISRFRELLELYMQEPKVIPLCKELERLRDGFDKFEIQTKKDSDERWEKQINEEDDT